MAYKKKLYKYNPNRPPIRIETFRTKRITCQQRSEPQTIERELRQLLADKISGNLVGIWLLIPEHLRLGTWDLLQSWSGMSSECVEPRLALQLVHERALCANDIRYRRGINQKGFEIANGLPFVASDQTMHNLLGARTVVNSKNIQIALGRIRRARGHFHGSLLAIDPHRLMSYSKRQMCRYKPDEESKAFKSSQIYFCLDADTHQPICFSVGTISRSVSQATPELLQMASHILNPVDSLVLADSEHFALDLIRDIHTQTSFELLVPVPNQKTYLQRMKSIPSQDFTQRWAGYATTKIPFHFQNDPDNSYFLYVQRCGETPQTFSFKGFLSTCSRQEAEQITIQYPKRWHIEEFFNKDQSLGWNRAGTMNLNIRYGQMTMALIAQTALHQFRERLGEPWQSWDSDHLARGILRGLEGDIRVHGNTIVVTFYNAPDADRLKTIYENLPQKLQDEHIDPRIPWLFNFKLDFQFK